MGAARAKGLEIPRDLSVIGFDDIPSVASIPPGLTTLRRRAERLGEEAARVLFRLLAGEDGRPGEIFVPTELEVRGSTAPPG
jgi:DNA-binding LacI/PurR family transcriptional regulator